MMTLSRMTLNTNCIAEQIRAEALNATLEKWKESLETYYSQGHDEGQTTKLFKELMEFGADPEQLVDIDLEIHDRYSR